MATTRSNRRGSGRWIGAGGWLALLLTCAAPALAQGPSAPETMADDHAHVLVITGIDPYLPAFVAIDRGMRTAMAQVHRGSVAWLYESIDVIRLGGAPGPELADLLAKKYEGTRIDAVVLIAEPAANFYLRFRDRLWPNVPVIVHSVVQSSADHIASTPGLTVLPARTDYAGTLRIARALQPRATRMLVVGGTSPADELQLATVRATLGPTVGIPVEYLVGSSPQDVAARLASEGPQTIVIYTSLFRDESGKIYIPREILEQLAASSAVPIFGAFDSYMGFGVTGGAMESFTERGERVAELVAEALERPMQTTAVALPLPSRCVVDARQLKRYGLSTDLLPEGCEVRFVEPSFLAQYWWQTLLVAVALAAQTLLIAGLLLERRSRRAAEVTLQAQRSQLLHAARLAVAGELTAAIAHEINQPLGAILSNADAAEMMLKGGSVDRDELLQILGDIRSDDLRASEVIRRLRAFLERQEVERRRCDLNRIAEKASAILGAEARRRGNALEYDLSARNPEVLGDPVQLQQVIIAIGLNAFDASATLPDGQRRIRIATADTPDGVRLTVRDFGVGIAKEDLSHVFDSFFTTKRSGMGLGLAIARTIVDAHGGTIEAVNCEQGAEFRVTLPLAPEETQTAERPRRRT